MSALIKICIRYALVAGVLATVMAIVTFYIGRHPMLISPFLDFRILLYGIFTYFSLREFRDYHQQGALYFFQAMMGSGMVVVVASVISSLGLYGFGLFEPGFVSEYVAQFVAYVKTFPEEEINRIGKDVVASNLKALSATNVYDLAITYFGHGLGIGFFVSIILSVIVRRQPKT